MSDESTTTDEAQERAARAAALAAEAGSLFGAGQPATGRDDDNEDTDELGGVPVVAVVDDSDDDSDSDDTDDSDDDTDDDTDEEDEDDEEEAAPALPSFGLIFQAPDLSDVPRRRARRAASSPPARPTGAGQGGPQHDDDGGSQGGADRDDADDNDSDNGDDGDAQGDGGNRGRRRRRGGKGRRGRGGPDSDQGDDTSSEGSEQGASTQDEQDSDGDDAGSSGGSRTRTRSRRGRGAASQGAAQGQSQGSDQGQGQTGRTGEQPGGEGTGSEQDDSSGTRRRRRRSRSGQAERTAQDEVTSVRGSTRLEAKRQRRREGREAGRRRTIITEAEFLARRESVERVMVVRGLEDRTQIAVLEDGVPVEHYVSRSAQTTMVGNVYLGRVQNVLPSMEAAFVDIGKGRNAVLYAGEVNWDAAGLKSNEPKRIENALKSGQSVLVQVTKDPIGHKGARLTSQVSLPGRYVVYVPGSTMTGISRKLPENERARLKKILKEVVPADVGVIVRTAAEGAAEAELRADVERLTKAWERIQAKSGTASAPSLLHGEPDMTVRVIRDVFNEDFAKLVVSGEQAWKEVKRYVDDVAPDLAERLEKYTGTADVFTTHRVHEAIAKAMDRKVWLPSGGSLVIDRTEAMTVVDVNTGKFTGSGGNLEETVTKNNIEAAEEIVRQLRLRDIGGIIVIDFIDMVLESNRDLVVRRLLECLGRDRTKHQVAEVTSLGLVQMTRKRVGSGLIEVFSETCTHCNGRGVHVHSEPAGKTSPPDDGSSNGNGGSRRSRGKAQGGRGSGNGSSSMEGKNVLPTPNPAGPTPAQIAAAAHAAALTAGASSEAAQAAAKIAEAAPAQAKETDEATSTPPAKATRSRSRASAPATAPATSPAKAPAKAAAKQAAAPAKAAAKQGAPAQTDDPAKAKDSAATTGANEAKDATANEAKEPAAKRRRRGRVVAPAGPPTAE